MVIQHVKMYLHLVQVLIWEVVITIEREYFQKLLLIILICLGFILAHLIYHKENNPLQELYLIDMFHSVILFNHPIGLIMII
jgi:hypothetical protein